MFVPKGAVTHCCCSIMNNFSFWCYSSRVVLERKDKKKEINIFSILFHIQQNSNRKQINLHNSAFKLWFNCVELFLKQKKRGWSNRENNCLCSSVSHQMSQINVRSTKYFYDVTVWVLHDAYFSLVNGTSKLCQEKLLCCMATRAKKYFSSCSQHLLFMVVHVGRKREGKKPSLLWWHHKKEARRK